MPAWIAAVAVIMLRKVLSVILTVLDEKFCTVEPALAITEVVIEMDFIGNPHVIQIPRKRTVILNPDYIVFKHLVIAELPRRVSGVVNPEYRSSHTSKFV